MTTQTILITGATGGIGLELARLYAQRGVRLVLVGRRPLAELDPALFDAASYCRADLGDPTAAQTVAAWLADQQITALDLLIHNAAIGYYGDPAEQVNAHILQMMQINLKTPIALTHWLLPALKQAKGKVVFVGSVVSVIPAADYTAYAASKAALEGLARNLALELEGQVAVQVLHPGATRTEIHQKSGVPRDKIDWEQFPPAAEVAQKMVRAIDQGARWAAIGLDNQLLRWMGSMFGRSLERSLRKQAAYGHLTAAPNPRPHVVITGVAEGIGRALALRFAEAGAMVTGLDINVGGALETKTTVAQRGGELHLVAVDLSQPRDIEQAVHALADQPAIDVLIHNAGISAAGHFAQLPLSEQLKVVDVNFNAPLLLTTELLRRQALVRGGSLVFVSSLSRYVGYPGAAVYGATKDGLSQYASGLVVALGEHSHLLTVYPGPTRTAHARRYSPDNSRESRRMSPEVVAEAIYEGVQAQRRVVIPGAAAKLFAVLGTLAPSLMGRVMKRAILDKFGGAG